MCTVNMTFEVPDKKHIDIERMEKARQEISEGKCTVLRSNEDINAFFDSL